MFVTLFASIVRVHIFFSEIIHYPWFKIMRQESKSVQCALNRHVHFEVASDNKSHNCSE